MTPMLTKIRRWYSQTFGSTGRGIAGRKNAQYEASHEARKTHVTLANKNGMGFNGL